MSEDPIPSWSTPDDDSPSSSRTLLRTIDAIRWYVANGDLSRATDNLDALEAVAGDEGPLSLSRVAECRAGIQAQQWDWAGALASLEWSRDLQARLNSKFAAEFTASRVQWLMGDREGALARVDALLERGPTGRLERSVALCLGYRTEAVDGPDDGERMWQGLFESYFTDWPIIGEIGFALVRLQAQRGDEPRHKAKAGK